jgi:hypothetical protein
MQLESILAVIFLKHTSLDKATVISACLFQSILFVGDTILITWIWVTPRVLQVNSLRYNDYIIRSILCSKDL